RLAGCGVPGCGRPRGAGRPSHHRSSESSGSQGVRLHVLIDGMFEALAQGASHPAVAVWFAMGTVAVAAVVVAMAWSVNVRQIRLAEELAKRQFVIAGGIAGIKRELEGAAGGEDAQAGEGPARESEGTAREGPVREGVARGK